tara:strand:+ start:601 stop:1572 length:972 start_codon:yes stop_codon:yes gene_type:complete
MEAANYPLFFIHISKTAGSSFRVAAERYFGKEDVFYDYGPNANETNPDIRTLDYQKRDRYAAGMKIVEKAKFLTGHINHPKYAPFIPAKNAITFVRDPIQQVRSHYEHFTRHHRYKKSFSEFVNEPRFKNVQYKAFQGTWPDAIGFIGLTERYSESLALINKMYSIDIQGLDINKNTEKKSSRYELSEEEVALVKKHNEQDFKLYEFALTRFERQKLAIESDSPFIRYGKTNMAKSDEGKMMKGWAADYDSQSPVALDVRVGKKKVAELLASEYRSTANERNIHRNGFIGFSFSYPKKLKDGSRVDFVAKDTGELVMSDIVSR